MVPIASTLCRVYSAFKKYFGQLSKRWNFFKTEPDDPFEMFVVLTDIIIIIIMTEIHLFNFAI